MPNQSGLDTSVAASATFDAHNRSRRRLLKSVSALMGYFTIAPALAGTLPISATNAQSSNSAQVVDSPSEVEFRFIDSKSIPGMTALGQGTIVNRSASDVTITDIAPNVMITDNGRYDISAYFAENPIQLVRGHQHHFWVRPLPVTNTMKQIVRQQNMHGSLSPSKSQRMRVLARIDNPSIGVDANVRPVVLTMTTSNA